MTSFEAIETALQVGCAVTGCLSFEQMLFSPTFDGYLDMVCERYNVQEDAEPEPEHDAGWIENEMYDQLRRGEG